MKTYKNIVIKHSSNGDLIISQSNASGRRRRYHSPEFKKEVVKLSYESELTIKEIGEQLDLATSLICKWRREYGNHKNPSTPLNDRESQLSSEITRLRKERDYLKELLMCFAKGIV